MSKVEGVLNVVNFVLLGIVFVSIRVAGFFTWNIPELVGKSRAKLRGG